MTGMCPLRQADVSSFWPDVSPFRPNVSSFGSNVSSFGRHVSSSWVGDIMGVIDVREGTVIDVATRRAYRRNST